MMQAYSKFTIVTLIIFIFCGLKIQQTSAQVASEVDACKKTPGYIAIVACSRLIQSDPKNSDAYYQRGLRFYFLGVYDRAISDFDETIRLNPKHADAYHSRGWIWHKTDLDKAIADYSEAIKFDSKDAAAYNDRGNAFYQKGEYEKAIADYKEAIKKFPKFSAANANLMAASDALKALVATANPRLSELLFVMSPRWYLIKGVATDGNSLMFRKYAIPSLKGQFGGIEQFKNTLSFACQRDSRFMNFVIFHIPKFADPNFNTDQWKPHYPVHISYDELRTTFAADSEYKNFGFFIDFNNANNINLQRAVNSSTIQLDFGSSRISIQQTSSLNNGATNIEGFVDEIVRAVLAPNNSSASSVMKIEDWQGVLRICRRYQSTGKSPL